MSLAVDARVGAELDGGKYEIVQRIGSGAMGTVYKALQPKLNRPVAIKILLGKLSSSDDARTRFRREVQTLAKLTHPNTVRVFDDGVLEDGAPYIVMEFLEGKTLKERLESGPLSVEEAIEVFGPLAEALEEAHRLRIVHRDLKPENVFLCSMGGARPVPKVLDFGLAKMLSNAGGSGGMAELTSAGTLLGTLEFMSPEQTLGRPLDHRSDIYSFGLILYEALTGKLPFDARNNAELMEAHRAKSPIPLRERLPAGSFSSTLQATIDRALAKSPDDRFQTMGEFASALRSGMGRTRTFSGKLPVAVAKSLGVANERGDVVSLSRAQAIRFAVLGGAVVMGLAALAFFLGRLV